ncbi:unnamed protein product [Mytilus coruscus]|uniref:Uncharacterized protein n=1 Tax=Mytilus coruscus TaxID=42192 RepID=A0A6J8AC46_MYTCO|nr:unnamed protein product [Mytilus coruscus]
MAQWICLLLLVVVAAVVTTGDNSYGAYPPKIARPDVYNSYPVQNHVVIHPRVVVDPGFHHHPGMGSYLKKYHGFKIRHGRFSYNGIGYKLTCGKTRFYRIWRSCYGKYHSRGRCFGRFRKQHLFAVYNGHTHGGHYGSRKYYKFHSHGHGHGYSHGNGHGYNHGHRHGVSYYSYYKKYHGFRIQHHRFSYGGKAFKLTCHRKRFFRLWNDCFTHHHSRSYCFGFLRKQHLFVTYGAGHTHGGHYGSRKYYKFHSHGHVHGYSHGHGHGYSHGHRHGVSFYSYYKKYHGFRIQHHRFSYGGKAFKLTCHRKRFFRLWNDCFTHHHSRSYCFGFLRKQHLFVTYGAGHTHGGHYGSRKYYKFHSHGHVHGYSHGHGHGYSHGHRHGVSFYSYYKKYHGFRIQHHRFSYGGKAFKLTCHRKRFFKLWNDCFTHHHSRNYCFGFLRKQHLFVTYGAGHHGYTYHGAGYEHGHRYQRHNNIYKHLNLHKKIDNHHVERIHHTANSHVSAISHLSNKHVRNIQYEARKHVSRISNEANKHINKFRQLVNHHINRLHKHAKHPLSGVEYQHKRHLSESEYQNKRHLANEEHIHKKHEYYLSKHHSMVDNGYDKGHVVTYLDNYKKYHGFRIDHDRFSYGGKAYTLKCESKRFYRLWSDCWSQYHSRSTCFEHLRKQHLFIDSPGDPYIPTKIVLKKEGDYEYKK